MWARGLIVAALLLSGCTVADQVGTASFVEPLTGRPPVIAIIDTGTIPQYDVFARGALPLPVGVGELPTLPVSAAENWEDRRAEDEARLASVEPARLYVFNDTRLLAITFAADDRSGPLIDSQRHGAVTTYLAARSAPEAWIVSIQVDPGSCIPPPCAASPSTVAAMQWAADQPWIDVISVSLGPPGSPPLVESVNPDAQAFVDASRRAVANGKIVIAAAGNQPTPATGDHFSGPPWVIAVGGADEFSRGEQYDAAKLIDVVANYTEWAPDGYDDAAFRWQLGTSFAAPNVAATFASALAKVRVAGAKEWPPGALAALSDGTAVHAGDFRAALNATAVQFAATEWRPLALRGHPAPDVSGRTVPILVQPQMGWGYVNSTMGEEIGRRVLEGDFSIPLGKEQGRAFQEQWQRAREDYWSR